MTREEALDEYWEAINSHDVADPKTKERVHNARVGLMPFLERSSDPRFSKNAIPLDLKKRFEAKK